jgi:hypothetical protein
MRLDIFIAPESEHVPRSWQESQRLLQLSFFGFAGFSFNFYHILSVV